jgi:acetylornithine deacetylase
MHDDLKPRLQAAIAANWPKQEAFLAELVRMPSLRGHEAPCQDFLARAFAARGWSVDRYRLSEIDTSHRRYAPMVDTEPRDHVQVVATLRAPEAKGRSLIVQGHVDVVPEGPRALWSHPPYAAQVHDGWMWGRGAHDMKSGVSAMVFALDALSASGFAPAGDVMVQAVTEEEATGNGALSTLIRGYRADACLIPEPTGHTITRAHVGVLWFRLKLRGEPVHVAVAQQGSNAIMSAYVLIQALAKLTETLNVEARSHPWFGSVPDPIKFNPGKIVGGDWASSTPAWCDVDCRIGLLPGTTPEAMAARVTEAVQAAARADGFLANNQPEILWNGFFADGYVLEPGSDAEAVLASAHAAVHGSAMPERLATGLNDTRFYGNDFGIPALCYGARGIGAHAFDERTDLASIKATTLVIALFIADWCGVVEKA